VWRSSRTQWGRKRYKYKGERKRVTLRTDKLAHRVTWGSKHREKEHMVDKKVESRPLTPTTVKILRKGRKP